MAQSEFERETLRQVAELHEGMAAAHLEHASGLRDADQSARTDRRTDRPPRPLEWSQDAMLAASGLVMAASCWSLIEPKRAVSLYGRAAKLYKNMGHSFWIVLALASGDARELAAIPRWVDEHGELPHVAVAFGMVAAAVVDRDGESDRSERLEAQWRHVGNVPVGRLRIPLDNYAVCARAMRALRHEPNRDSFLGAVMDYIGRAAEVRRAASHDTFHWNRLMSTVLPAEPEAVAMITAMSTMSRATFQRPLRELVPDLESHARILVEVGDQMRGAAQDDERFRR